MPNYLNLVVLSKIRFKEAGKCSSSPSAVLHIYSVFVAARPD